MINKLRHIRVLTVQYIKPFDASDISDHSFNNMTFSFFIIKTEKECAGEGGPQKTILNNMMIRTGILIYELPEYCFSQYDYPTE